MQVVLRILIFVNLLCWAVHPLSAAGLEATVDRTKVTEGDGLTLHLVAPTNAQNDPDLSVLTTDFAVLSQSQSTSITIINGNASSSSAWDITIMPKRTGTLTIPAIKLGSMVSEPISLQVLPASQSQPANEPRPILVEVDVDTTTPYVQAQVIYKVRVLYRRKVRQMRLADPKVTDAILEPLGVSPDYKVDRNGETYNVKERLYAILPKRSGKLTIEGPLLTAMTPDTSGRNMVLRDPFFDIPFGDPFGDTNSPFIKPIQTRGRNIALEVKPQPIGINGPWLPATQLQITETWDTNPPKFRVNDPTTRTITVIAHGPRAAQIPDLEFAVPTGIKTYADKPQGQDQSYIDGLVATKVFKQALIPERPGKITLPAINLSWWNTKTDKLAAASIPARTIEVLSVTPSQLNDAATKPVSTQNAIQQPSQTAPTDPSSTQDLPLASKTASATTPTNTNSPQANLPTHWMWIAIAFGGAWLITLSLWLLRDYRHRRDQKRTKTGLNKMAVSMGTAINNVKQSCRANDAKATRTALLAWGAARWPDAPPTHLEDLAARLGPEVVTVVQELDRCLYSQQNTDLTWHGELAWQVLAGAMAPAPSTRANPLPDLYAVATK